MRRRDEVAEAPAFMSLRATTERLGIGLTTVKKLVATGSLRSRRLEGRKLILRADVEALVQDVNGEGPAPQ
jgi:excisionase family DNA binding protein